jgi:hypothetical protein
LVHCAKWPGNRSQNYAIKKRAETGQSNRVQQFFASFSDRLCLIMVRTMHQSTTFVQLGEITERCVLRRIMARRT